MRPYALVESSPESLGRDEISRGRLHKAGDNGYLQKSYDLLTSFQDVLGKRVREVPGNYASGEFVRDTSMDLETNVSAEFTTGNSLLLQDGSVSKSAVIKIAQTFRTGTNDIDALDYVFMYLNDEKQSHSERTGESIAVSPHTTTALVCHRFSPQGCASKTISIGFGSSRMESCRPIRMPYRRTSRITICGTRWRWMFLMKRSVRC
jgi:hypothetical protein